LKITKDTTSDSDSVLLNL